MCEAQPDENLRSFEKIIIPPEKRQETLNGQSKISKLLNDFIVSKSLKRKSIE